MQPIGRKSVASGGDSDVAVSEKLEARVWQWRFCCGGLQRIGSMALTGVRCFRMILVWRRQGPKQGERDAERERVASKEMYTDVQACKR